MENISPTFVSASFLIGSRFKGGDWVVVKLVRKLKDNDLKMLEFFFEKSERCAAPWKSWTDALNNFLIFIEGLNLKNQIDLDILDRTNSRFWMNLNFWLFHKKFFSYYYLKFNIFLKFLKNYEFFYCFLLKLDIKKKFGIFIL